VSIEQEVAQRIVHQENIAKKLERTGGEIIHPDHYDFRQDFRSFVLDAMDDASEKHGMAMVVDKDLPELFKTLDYLAERLFLRREGLEK
jgi:hypothetical protein